MTTHRGFTATALLLCLALVLGGCMTTDPYTGERKVSKTTVGAGIGALGGAAAGAAIGAASGGHRGRRAATGAAIGAGVGAATGGGIGYYMDQQEAKLRQRLERTGVSVTRSGDNIILNMPGNITFRTDSSDISSGFYDVLNSVALVLNEFDRTYVDVQGHTDSTGSDSYNQTLSERRARSVADYLTAQRVASHRLGVQGFGESRPIASNDTEAGRAQNRRVEIQIAPVR
jgi:outer membrane protein OmpA-like peptidoglycan-associated protein